MKYVVYWGCKYWRDEMPFRDEDKALDFLDEVREGLHDNLSRNEKSDYAYMIEEKEREF